MHKSKAGKLQTGSTFPKQYWLAVNGKPKNNVSWSIIFIRICGFQWLKMILVIWFIINWGKRRRSGIRGRFWIKNHFEKKL